MTMQTGTTKNDTLIFVPGDTAIDGSTGTDTLVFNQTNADLTSTVLTSVEILKAGLSTPTTFTVNPADLAAGGSVVGSSGADTLIVTGTLFDLRSTALTSIEILQSATTADTKFLIDQADLAKNGSITGSTATADTVTINGISLDLTSTTLTNIDGLIAGKSTATTFTVDAADFAALGSFTGSSGNDTLVLKDTAFDLTSTSLTSIEILKAGSSLATTFTVDPSDLAANGSVVGSSGTDMLIVTGTLFDLRSTALTSVEILQAATTANTSFLLDQADLAKGGSIIGSTATADTVTINGTSLDLTSTTLTNIDGLIAGKSVATTFTVDAADFAALGSFTGSSGNDTLILKSTAFDLTSTSLTSIEILKAGLATATTFTVDQSDLAANGSVVGSSGVDKLTILGTDFDLRSSTLTSVEQLISANTGTNATTFTVDQADLMSGGSVIGTANADILKAAGTSLNLASTTLTSIEILRAGNTGATTFIVDKNDLASGGSVEGIGGKNDTLTVNNTAFDLTSTTLTSIEILKAGLASATTFTVEQNDLLAGGSVAGSTGSDTLTILGTDFNLSSTALTSVERLLAQTTNATTFSLDQNDLASGGSIIGHSTATDAIVAAGTTLNLSSTTLTSIETLTAGTTNDTVLTINQTELANLAISGNAGNDTLQMAGTLFDLTSITLTSIENLGAALATATTFKVNPADLVSGGSVTGNAGIDTLIISGTGANLASTTLTSIEKLVAATSNNTLFTVNQADLKAGGSVVGSSGTDTLNAADNTLDISSTTLTSIEKLQAGLVTATTFIVDQADLSNGGSVNGSSGIDTLSAAGTALNLTSTTLNSIEVLSSVNSKGTTFTLDITDLTGLSTITGSTGASDALVVLSSVIDLSAKAVTAIETLKAGLNIATTFTVDQADLATGGSVIGGSGVDFLVAAGTQLNLTSTTLTSVETLQAGSASATTFTVDQADLAKGGAINGSTGNDTLVTVGSALDLTSTTLTSIEILKSTNSAGTKFTIDVNDLAGFGTITGSTGAADILVVTSTAFDLSSTTTTGIETLQAGIAAATTFTVDATDLVANGFVKGSTGADTLTILGTAFDLSSTGLSSIEKLVAAGAVAVTFTVDQSDLASGGTVAGITGKNDTLQIAGSSLDLTSTALSSIESLTATLSTGTTFTVNQADLVSGGSVAGHSGGTDTLVAADTQLDLSSTTLSSIETLKAGKPTGTTFTVNQDDIDNLGTTGSVQGHTSGSDKLVTADTELDLSSTTLTSIETLKAGNTNGTTFTVNQTDLASGGTVAGSTIGSDTLVAADTQLDLSSTTLTSIETLTAGLSDGTTFTVNQADIAALGTTGSIQGHTDGSDKLVAADTQLDLSSTTLTSIETLQAKLSTGTTLTVNQADLVSNGTVAGHTGGSDKLVSADTALDLTSTTLTSIETLKAGTSNATEFTVDQVDLVSGGSVLGSTSIGDQLTAGGSSLDLTSTTLSSVEILAAGTTDDTTFKVDQTDLASGGSILGNTGSDTLVINGVSLNLASTATNDIEILKAGLSTATTFTVNQGDLANSGTVQGSSGIDTLITMDTQLDLSSTTLTSIEILKAGLSTGTTFTLNQPDIANLASTGAVQGHTGGNDILVAADTELDLTSTTLTSIESLKAGLSTDTTFTVNQADIAALGTTGSVQGHSLGADTLATADSQLDLTSTLLSSIESLKATLSTGTTFTVNQGDIANLGSTGSIEGHSSGADTLVAADTQLDLSSTTLSSIETLKAGKSTGTTFIVNQDDIDNLGTTGSVQGHTSGSDKLVAADTQLDLTSTTLTSIETLKAGNSNATTFTVNQADLASGGTVAGSTGSDTLVTADTQLDLSSTSLSSIETLKAGLSDGTTFTLNQADIAALGTTGSIQGDAGGSDKLVAADTQLDLSSTTLTSIETLQAKLSTGTTFTVNQADIAALGTAGSVQGHTGGSDKLVAADTQLDLTTTTLTSIETLQAKLSTGTTFTVNQTDLASGGTVAGHSGGSDTLETADTQLDLSSTTVSSIETLQAGTTDDTVFTVNQTDLASNGTVAGNSGADTLVAADTQLDLSSATLSSIETLQAKLSAGTTFTLNQADLVSLGTAGSIEGHTGGTDKLVAADTQLDLTSTALTSIEILKAGLSAGTTFTVNQADLASGGTVAGHSSGSDVLVTMDTELDLSSTTLTSIEILKAGLSTDTTFTVNQADLASGGTVVGHSNGSDTLAAADAQLDLTSTTLASIETLRANLSTGTTFTVNQDDIANLGTSGSIQGHSSGTDTLIAADTELNLTSTTLTSIEILKAGKSTGTTFTVNQDDIANLGVTGSIQGHSSGSDKLVTADSELNLSSTTLTSIESLLASLSTGTTFTVNQADLASGGTVAGHTGGIDTLVAADTQLDLSSTALTSIETLQAGLSTGTTFIVNQVDLASGGTVAGHTGGTDTLTIHGTSLNLTSTTLDSIETLSTDSSLGTTFTVSQDSIDSLGSTGSIHGHSSGGDTLLNTDTQLDLTSTTLTSIETLKAGLSTGTTFAVDQNDLVSGGSVVGHTSGADILVVNGNTVDLSSTTLISVETIETAIPSNGTTFTIGGGQGGATVELTVNGETDTIGFTAAYKVTDTTNDASILAHTLTLDNFNDGGTNGDLINISNLTNGAPSQSLDITNFITLISPATLKDALNVAAAGNGVTTSTVVSFQYGGDTYILVDKSASSALTADDAVIKLVGAHTLTDLDNFSL